jgi:RNA-binding protein
MSLTETLKRELRGRGHSLKPVVSVGSAGLSPAVLREIDLSLEHHELMKIRISGADREARNEMIGEICHQLRADLVQAIGHIALIYREAED